MKPMEAESLHLMKPMEAESSVNRVTRWPPWGALPSPMLYPRPCTRPAEQPAVGLGRATSFGGGGLGAGLGAGPPDKAGAARKGGIVFADCRRVVGAGWVPCTLHPGPCADCRRVVVSRRVAAEAAVSMGPSESSANQAGWLKWTLLPLRTPLF